MSVGDLQRSSDDIMKVGEKLEAAVSDFKNLE